MAGATRVNRNVNWVTDDSGNLVGYDRSPGDRVLLLSADASASAVENEYTKALFFGNALTQTGSVNDFSQANNDAVYCGSTTDSEVYNTTANYLSMLGGTSPNNKGLALTASKLQWDLDDGESLLVQTRFYKPTALPGSQEHIFGNASGGTIPGFLLAIAPSGVLQPYIKVGSLGIALLGGSSTTAAVADTAVNVTLWIDGGTKTFNGWINGTLQSNWTNKAVTPDGSSYSTVSTSTPGVWCLGNGGDTVSPSIRTMNAFKFAAHRVMVIEPGKTLQNAAMLDWLFNRDPNRLLPYTDLVLV